MEKLYKLVNIEGCLMGSIATISFRSARFYFNDHFAGKYKIVCGSVSKNVILK